MHKFTKKCSFQCFLFVIFEGVVQQAQQFGKMAEFSSSAENKVELDFQNK
jgi:hypothetical protein